MHNPKDVFDNPDSYKDFLTIERDDDFEGRFFDRKEVGRTGSDGNVSRSSIDKSKENIQKSLSAFANTDRPGGLLVLGISTRGKIKGIKHLSEKQLNDLTNLRRLLRGHAVQQKRLECVDETGEQNEIYFMYSQYMESTICETTEDPPRAWLRHGT